MKKQQREAAIRSIVPRKPKVPKRRRKRHSVVEKGVSVNTAGLAGQEMDMPCAWISGDKASPDILLGK